MTDNFQVGYEGRFVMGNNDAVMGGQLTAYEIAVYVVLCGYASSTDKTCFPSYSTLGAKAGCSRCTAIRAVTRLEELGFILKQGQTSKKGDPTSNRYLIRAVIPAPSTAVENSSEAEGVVSDSDHPSLSEIPPLVSDRYHGGITDRHELNVSNQTYSFNHNHSLHPPRTRMERGNA